MILCGYFVAIVLHRCIVSIFEKIFIEMRIIVKLAIFDLDGTILDTLEDLTESVNYALVDSGFPKRSLDEVRTFVGNGILKLIQRAVPLGTADKDVDKVYDTFKDYYKEHCADKTKPYAGILQLLSDLRKQGCKTAVVSNKADFAVRILCEKYFDGLFDMVLGARDGVRKKPYPDAVLEVLERMEVQKSEAVYIGDSEVDIDTANNAGLSCISVDWGFRTRDFLIEHGACNIVSSVDELLLP